MPALNAVSIPSNYLVLLSLLAIAGGFYFLIAGLQFHTRKRKILSTPTSIIQRAQKGLVEITGRAVGPKTILAPISGKACFLYRVIAWQGVDGKKDWKMAADETLHLPFYLDDSTGQMLIEPLAAELDLDRDVCEEFVTSIFSSSDDIQVRVSTFLARNNLGNDRPLRIEEFLIKPDDTLFITGTLADNPGVEAKLRENQDLPAAPPTPKREQYASASPEVVRLYGGAPASSATQMTQQGKIAAALMRAGINKPEAWSAAGLPHPSVAIENGLPPEADALKEAAYSKRDVSNRGVADPSKSKGSETPFDLKPPVVLMKGDDDPTFVISCRSQKELITALSWKAGTLLCSGAAIATIALYTLMLQFAISR